MALLLDDAVVLPLLLLARNAPELQGLREEADEGERRLELVAHVRHEVALLPREVHLPPHVAVHEIEAGAEHQVDEGDERHLSHRHAAHVLFDGPIAVAEEEAKAPERRALHDPLDVEVVVGRRRVLVEELAGGLCDPDDPRGVRVRVGEVVLEVLLDDAPVGVRARIAEPQDADHRAVGSREWERVLFLDRGRRDELQRLPKVVHVAPPRPERLRQAGDRARRLEAQADEGLGAEPTLVQGFAYLGLAPHQEALRSHDAGRLQGPGPSCLLEVLLDVEQDLLRLLHEPVPQALGVFRHGVERDDREGYRGKEHRPDEDRDDAPLGVGRSRDLAKGRSHLLIGLYHPRPSPAVTSWRRPG